MISLSFFIVIFMIITAIRRMQPAMIATNFILMILLLFYNIIIIIFTSITKMQPAIIATNINQLI